MAYEKLVKGKGHTRNTTMTDIIYKMPRHHNSRLNVINDKLTVPKHSNHSKIIQPSPTQSFSSIISEVSQEKEKKKKKGLFRF